MSLFGKADGPELKPQIAKLKDENWSARRGAAETLGNLGDVRAVEPLIACLKDRDHYVRGCVAEALGKLGDARAVEPLTACLNDYDHDVRLAVAKALGKLSDTRAVNPLVASALSDSSYSVQMAAKDALRKLGIGNSDSDLIKIKDENNLARWKASGGPEKWVRQHNGRWEHRDWLGLLSSLYTSEFWPMDEASIGAALEAARDGSTHQAPSDSSGVKFIREEKGVDAVLGAEPVVKRIYSAPNREIAVEFLRNNSVRTRMFFIEIDTPEGRVGRDIDGLYDENGNIGESSSSPTKVVVVFGTSVPLSSLEDQAKAIAKTSAKGVVLCGPTFEAAMSASNLVIHLTPGGASTARAAGVSMRNATEALFKYRTLSPCTLVFSLKLPESSFGEVTLTDASLTFWFKEHFAKALLNHLNQQNFRRENMPKIRLEASREDRSVSAICSWEAVDGDICKRYALALESAQEKIGS